MSLIVLYFLRSTSVLSFHIDVVLTLSIKIFVMGIPIPGKTVLILNQAPAGMMDTCAILNIRVFLHQRRADISNNCCHQLHVEACNPKWSSKFVREYRVLHFVLRHLM